MIQEILSVLTDLRKPDFDVHTIDDAWYSPRSMIRAIGNPLFEEYPEIKVVRVSLKSGMLELHPTEDNQVCIRCYCCFDGNPERGTFPLDKLKEAIVALKDHFCPPWPG